MFRFLQRRSARRAPPIFSHLVPSDSVPVEHVPFRTRLFVYSSFWLVAALILLLTPESGATTFERVNNAIFAPLVVVFGLSLVVTFPQEPSGLVPFVTGGLLLFHAIVTLTQTRLSRFRILVVVHLVLLAVAATYLVRFSHLPSGG